MEELIELIVKPIYYIVRATFYIIYKLACEKIFWYLGWPVVKILTLGHLPKQSITDGNEANFFVFIFVVIVGGGYPLAIGHTLYLLGTNLK